MAGFAIGWIVGFGAVSAWLAARRARSAAAWAVFGAIIGPIAVILLWLSPPGRCAVCDAPVGGWASVCTWCGNDVHGFPIPQAAAVAPVGPTARSKPAPVAEATPSPSAATLRPRPEGEPMLPSGPAPAPAIPTAAISGERHRSPSTRRSPARPTTSVASDSPPAEQPVTIATGVFITGSVGLTPGSRYMLQIDGTTFRVCGPVDQDPSQVALSLPLASVDATAYENRLVLNERSRGSGGTVLAFMSLAGGTAASVAESLERLSAGRAG